jgi:hypothetical protein
VEFTRESDAKALLFAPFAITLMICVIWFIFPYGQWGLMSILFSYWAYKTGLRNSLLFHFITQLTHDIKSGLTYSESWNNANQKTCENSEMEDINITQHIYSPVWLMRYVISEASKSEMRHILIDEERLQKAFIEELERG